MALDQIFTHFVSRQSAIYILSNVSRRSLYTGVTGDLIKRVWQHKHGVTGGFTSRYRVTRLVYFEVYIDIRDAIVREKQIKGGSREAKIRLIESMNPDWQDLYHDLCG